MDLQEALMAVNKDGVFEDMASKSQATYEEAMKDFLSGKLKERPVRPARIRTLDSNELHHCRKKLHVIKAEGKKLEEIYRLVNLLDTVNDPKLTDIDSMVELGVLDTPRRREYRRVTDRYLSQIINGDLRRTVISKLEVLAGVCQKAIAVRNKAAAGVY